MPDTQGFINFAKIKLVPQDSVSECAIETCNKLCIAKGDDEICKFLNKLAGEECWESGSPLGGGHFYISPEED